MEERVWLGVANGRSRTRKVKQLKYVHPMQPWRLGTSKLF